MLTAVLSLDSRGVAHSSSKLGLLPRVEADPVTRPGAAPSGLEHAPFDPIVHHTGADAELLGDLLHAQFSVFPELGSWNLVTEANPADHRNREGLALGAEASFGVECGGDVAVMKLGGQAPDPLHHLLRITDPVRSA